MNTMTIVQADTLPVLIDRATAALDNARNSAEVLEARDMARVAYDAAKSAGRIAKAKQAHDSLIAEVHRAQAHALAIESRAKMRLADEYDAAQERGEVRGNGERGKAVVDHNGISGPATAADLGIRRDEIHEARQLRNAEQEQPGLIRQALDAMIDRREEPTRAALRRSVLAAVDDAKGGSSKPKNPLHRKDADTDRVFKFSGLCRSLAEFSDVESIAAWSGIRQTAERLPAEVRAAMLILSRFMEAQDA